LNPTLVRMTGCSTACLPACDGLIAGVDEKGALIDRGIDKIAKYLNGTDSHELKHEVSSRRYTLCYRL
jgi:hypothetical protein